MFNTSDEAILEKFPFKEPRDGQIKAVREILSAFNAGKKVAMLEAGTGSGKSVIGITVANFFSNSYYLTPQKILQTQIINDFENLGVVDLKGRSTYPCTYWNSFIEHSADRGKTKEEALKEMEVLAKMPMLSATMANKYLACNKGICKIKDGKSKCKLCFPAGLDSPQTYCPYWQRLSQAQQAKICLMNFSSFLYQTAIGDRFGQRDLMIIDEAHSSDSALMDFISFALTDKNFTKFNIKIPNFETTREYIDYFNEIDLAEKIMQQAQEAIYSGDTNAEEEWKRALWQYKNFMKTSSSSNWVPVYEDDKKNRKITLKPIFVNEQAQDYVFKYADKFLLMSATILSPSIIYDSLGIKKEEAFAYRMGNKFPIKNRPIYYKPSGSMSFKNKQDTLPILANDTDTICKKYQDKRGIIHTHTFDIARYLLDKCSPETSQRFLYQEDWRNKDEMLKEHGKRQNSIIVAPAMHEGLSLNDDLSRFQIICKVPYPSYINNKQLKIRMEMSQNYYDWLTSIKTLQCAGRSVRSMTDYADTYILDQDFKQFVSKTKASKLLPSWFLEAIIWE